MANRMYLDKRSFLLQNGTTLLNFTGVETQRSSGQAQCSYTGGTLNWPSKALFFSDANQQLYAQPGDDTDWPVFNSDLDLCPDVNIAVPTANATACPLAVTPPPQLKM